MRFIAVISKAYGKAMDITGLNELWRLPPADAFYSAFSVGSGLVLGFVAMELTSQWLHRVLFHGPLWWIHQSHHVPNSHSAWEKNDLFSLAFALSAIALILYGSRHEQNLLLGIGLGITAYGLIYFWVHDLLTHHRHKRFLKTTKALPLPRNRFLRRVIQAHRRHHQKVDRIGNGPYGLFF